MPPEVIDEKSILDQVKTADDLAPIIAGTFRHSPYSPVYDYVSGQWPF